MSKEASKKMLVKVRESFARCDWDGTATAYEHFAEIDADRASHLEATCLAVRALAAAKHRSAARHLIKTVAAANYRKAIHYDFLARAYLDLKQYKETASACGQAETLRAAEVK